MELIAFGYLGALIFSIIGTSLIDKRQGLALFVSPVATIISVFIGVAVFLAWDLVGIELGIFFIGPAEHVSGILIAPELPLEELFFLILLSYSTLIVYRLAERRLK
ncbi:MAG: lycopene cyclase domain-containing protein [Microbacteriaceae bacterium]|nr:lycopene cyclase domain-containing protein [Microbacteriaceae bacterium]MDR9443849.1 lycopene cyclase domain-containing protein [Microbacteriaceae bacterium]